MFTSYSWKCRLIKSPACKHPLTVGPKKIIYKHWCSLSASTSIKKVSLFLCVCIYSIGKRTKNNNERRIKNRDELVLFLDFHKILAPFRCKRPKTGRHEKGEWESIMWYVRLQKRFSLFPSFLCGKANFLLMKMIFPKRERKKLGKFLYVGFAKAYNPNLLLHIMHFEKLIPSSLNLKKLLNDRWVLHN